MEAPAAPQGEEVIHGTNAANNSGGGGEDPVGPQLGPLSEEQRQRIREKALEAQAKKAQRLQRQQLEMPPPPPPSGRHPISDLLCSLCRARLHLQAGSDSYHCAAQEQGCQFRLAKSKAELPQLKIMFAGLEVLLRHM